MVIWPWSRRPEDNNCWQKILSRYWECCTFVCFIMFWVVYLIFLNALIRYWHDLAGLPSSAIPRRPTSWGTSHTFSRNYQVVLKFLWLFWLDSILFVFWFSNFWNYKIVMFPRLTWLPSFDRWKSSWKFFQSNQPSKSLRGLKRKDCLCGCVVFPTRSVLYHFCRWCHGHFRSLALNSTVSYSPPNTWTGVCHIAVCIGTLGST